MASYDKCIKFESEKPKGVIRLVEANGFYRAYNHSAYVFHQVIAQHKVTKKFVKNINQEIVYVGFPVDKLLERIGDRSHKKTELGYDVELSHYDSYCVRKVLVAKCRLQDFGTVSDDHLRFCPDVVDWKLYNFEDVKR